MKKIEALAEKIKFNCSDVLQTVTIKLNQLTLEVSSEHVYSLLLQLRDSEDFQFDTLIDICGVDYLQYGVYEWDTQEVTTQGFSRGVEPLNSNTACNKKMPQRFAVVYHLLSTFLNHRIRVRVFCNDDALPLVNSVVSIWKAADWFEREAYDLYGILFDGHPDLRRILTDYGFIGHPFRKDFPLSGHVEMRYDAKAGKVIYEPVDIIPRILVPKVSRLENNYQSQEPSHG